MKGLGEKSVQMVIMQYFGLKIIFFRAVGSFKILVWQVKVNLRNIGMADLADNSKFLDYWYGSCHTLPPGSNGPVL